MKEKIPGEKDKHVGENAPLHAEQAPVASHEKRPSVTGITTHKQEIAAGRCSMARENSHHTVHAHPEKKVIIMHLYLEQNGKNAPHLTLVLTRTKMQPRPDTRARRSSEISTAQVCLPYHHTERNMSTIHMRQDQPDLFPVGIRTVRKIQRSIDENLCGEETPSPLQPAVTPASACYLRAKLNTPGSEETNKKAVHVTGRKKK